MIQVNISMYKGNLLLMLSGVTICAATTHALLAKIEVDNDFPQAKNGRSVLSQQDV